MNLLKTKEVAARLRLSQLTVLRLVDSGALAVVEVAQRQQRRLLRFRPETIEAFITSHEKSKERASGATAEGGSDATPPLRAA